MEAVNNRSNSTGGVGEDVNNRTNNAGVVEDAVNNKSYSAGRAREAVNNRMEASWMLLTGAIVLEGSSRLLTTEVTVLEDNRNRAGWVREIVNNRSNQQFWRTRERGWRGQRVCNNMRNN